MHKYERVVSALAVGEDVDMKAFGPSMEPLIRSGSVLTFRCTDDYEVGDVVFSRVKGRIIAAHRIARSDAAGRFLISNNKGRENGWTKKVFGRVIAVDGEPFGRACSRNKGP